MTVRTKITFTIIGTLLVGMFLGVAGTRIAFEVLGPPPGEFDPDDMPRRLTTAFERALDPTDTQRDTVHAILIKHAEIAAVCFQEHMAEQQSLMDSLKAELSAVVTPDQMERLDHRLQFMKRAFDGPRHGRGMGRRQGGPPPHPDEGFEEGAPPGEDFRDDIPPGDVPPDDLPPDERSVDSGR